MDHLASMPGTHETSQSPASSVTSKPSNVATPGNQTPLQVPSYRRRITMPSETFGSLPLLAPRTMQPMSALTSLIPTLRRPSLVCGSSLGFVGRAHRTRIRSVLGKVPWMPHPSANPADVEASLDSSSAKLLYDCVRDNRLDALRVTWGSEVRSQVPASSSAEDREASDEDGFLGVCGGNIFSLM